MEVAVESLTKFGFKANGEFINWSKKFDEASKAQVIPGSKLSVQMYIADSGKQYVNQILKQLGSTVDPLLVAPVFAKTPTVKPLAQPLTKAPATETMSKAEWSAKDRSQLIGGLSHDAATLAASIVPMSPYTTVEEVLAKYKFFLEGMLKIRDEVR
jgi:hypothetical protein